MSNEITLKKIQRETCVIKCTHTKKGRTLSVTPENTVTRHLGRIENARVSLPFYRYAGANGA